MKGLHEALVRYGHAEREGAGRGAEEIRVVRASLEAKASHWRARLEQCQAELAACQERAAQAAGDGPKAGDGRTAGWGPPAGDGRAAGWGPPAGDGRAAGWGPPAGDGPV